MKLLLLFVLLLSHSVEAQIFTIEVTDYGGTDSIPALKRFIDEELQKFENQVNADIPDETPHQMMKGMANTNALAGKGIGQDYASYMDFYLIGAGVGAAADFKRENTLDSDISGIGAATGMVVGVKLSKINVHEFAGLDTKKLNLYFNMMNYGHTHEVKDNDGVDSDIQGDFMNLGVHFRYDWIEGSGDPWLGWGGLKLHWGYQYSKSEITFKNQLDHVFNAVDVTQGEINGRITGNPKYRVETQTHSIPLEISTDVRFLNFMSLYGGLGTDFNYGKSKGKGLLDGDVTPLICTGGGFCGGGQIIQMQVQANLDAEAHVDPLFLRTFAGLQFNIPYFRLFAQVDKVIGTELLGATLGLRFVY